MAGFHTWRRLGRFVRRGEQAVWILAPVTRRGADEESDNTVRTVVAFRPVAVFAEDQTDGEALPELCTRLHGDDLQGAYAGLVHVAHSLGFAVEDHAFDGETNGDCSNALQRIRIKTTLEPIHRAKTLAHELAHAILHMDRSERPLMELEAESVAFVGLRCPGHRRRRVDIRLCRGWSGGGEQAITAIKAAGTRIQRTVERILLGLNLAVEPTGEGET